MCCKALIDSRLIRISNLLEIFGKAATFDGKADDKVVDFDRNASDKVANFSREPDAKTSGCVSSK